MTEGRERSGYPIAAVSKLTGVSCHALRVWERRYGFPLPRRSGSGHRRYPPEQVALLQQIVQRLQGGLPIRDAMAELQAGQLGPVEPVGSSAVGVEMGPNAHLLELLLEGDLGGAEAEFERLGGERVPVGLVHEILEPSLIEVGERWFRGECSVFQEHLASAFLRRKLLLLLEASRKTHPGSRGKVLVGTIHGDEHEGGVLILSILLELAGWTALNVGVDLPVSEYVAAVEYWKPRALALSFVLSRNINKRFQELAGIRSVPVVVGGRSILNYQRLARQHGLIPLAGRAVDRMEALVRILDEHMAEAP